MWIRLAIMMLSALSAQAGLSKLEAISMIETCDRDWIVGKAGERSRYQIMPSVWSSSYPVNSLRSFSFSRRPA